MNAPRNDPAPEKPVPHLTGPAGDDPQEPNGLLLSDQQQPGAHFERCWSRPPSG
jgi:hypothetical protein